MKKKIIVYSAHDKIIFRDLFETNFYSELENNFDVTWIFSGKLKRKLRKRSKIITLQKDLSYRNLIWTIIFYLEELKLYSFWNWPNLNTQLYLTKRLRFIIKSIYFLKVDRIIKFFFSLILTKTRKNFSFFKKHEIFINIGGGKDLLADDLTRNAKNLGLKTIFIPAAWDNISSKPFLEKPDHVCVWGPQTSKLCKILHNIEPYVLGVSKFDIYRTKLKKSVAKKKLKLNKKFKYLLVSGSSVVFNEKKFINQLEKFLLKRKYNNYKIIYRPHPFSQIRKYDEDINYKESNKIIIDPTASSGFKLKDYPYLLSAVEGVITPYSTMILEAINYQLPCLALGYFEKNSVHFNWKSFVLNAPHLQILKGKKFIIHCLEINKIEYSLNKFFDLIPKKKLYKYQMKQLTSKIVFQSKEKYAQKLKKIIYK